MPPEFDYDKLVAAGGALETSRIVAFDDETHKQQVFDGLRKHTSKAKHQLRFKRDKSGKVDRENGEYGPERTELHVKYYEESRYCLGVAAVQMPDGIPWGHCSVDSAAVILSHDLSNNISIYQYDTLP
eukprot:COSAG05_NODE_79_length_21178_cov_133.299492_16_plen_128_part_00